MSIAVLSLLATLTCQVAVLPKVSTTVVGPEVGDPAIWINRQQPAQSVIYGTNRMKSAGNVTALGLDGKPLFRIDKLESPYGIDVEYGFALGSTKVDIAVVTERGKNQLRIYRIDPADGKLAEVTGSAKVVEGGAGIALYKRPGDGEVFAFITIRKGPADACIVQYHLVATPTGKVDAKEIRRFGKFSGRQAVDSVCVDDELGMVYYSDEVVGVRKYSTDEKTPAEIALISTSGFFGNNKGLAMYTGAQGEGYLVCADRLPGDSLYAIYNRQNQGAPIEFHGGADTTDAIDVCSAPLGPQFPNGILVASNMMGGNYLIWNWKDVTTALKIR